MRSRTAIRGDTAATQAQQPRDSTKISVSPITATSIAKCSLFGQGLFDLCEATGSAPPALRSLRIPLRGGNRRESPMARVPHGTPIEWKPPESTFVDKSEPSLCAFGTRAGMCEAACFVIVAAVFPMPNLHSASCRGALRRHLLMHLCWSLAPGSGRQMVPSAGRGGLGLITMRS